jgi:RecB family exonuclease
MLKSVIAAALAVLAGGASPAPAVRDAETDLRCMIGATVASERADDDKVKQQLLGAAAFYMGRIDSRLTDAQVEAKMVEMAPTMASVDWQQEMTACGEYMRQRGGSFQEIGARLSKSAGH